MEFEELKYFGDDITFCTAECETDCVRKPSRIKLNDRPHSFADFSRNCMAYEPKDESTIVGKHADVTIIDEPQTERSE